MSGEHIPAWKRIAIKQKAQGDGEDIISNDPLNVTTHLATGSLTKKEKKRIINGDTGLKKSTGKVSKASKKEKKREKLPKDARESKKNKVLKDQLRYLIEFYRFKIEQELPEEVKNLENVKVNIDFQEAPKDENGVVDIWKFSKQKQNWLIKHFFTVEEIPVAYDSLLISYFGDLQGRAKDELLEKCQAKAKEWNEYVTAEEEKIKAIVEAPEASEKKEDEESEDKETESDKKKAEELKKEEEQKPVPIKEVAQRCHKLLKKWLPEDKIEEFELKNF